MYSKDSYTQLWKELRFRYYKNENDPNQLHNLNDNHKVVCSMPV